MGSKSKIEWTDATCYSCEFCDQESDETPCNKCYDFEQWKPDAEYKIKEENKQLSERIAELESESTQAKSELAALKEENAQLKTSLDNDVAHWKRAAEQARIQQFAPMLPSEMCNKHHVQNCHCCDNLKCGDNASEAKKRIEVLEADLEAIKESQCWHPASEPQEEGEYEIIQDLVGGRKRRFAWFSEGMWHGEYGIVPCVTHCRPVIPMPEDES